jgi:hypothetical protein
MIIYSGFDHDGDELDGVVTNMFARGQEVSDLSAAEVLVVHILTGKYSGEFAVFEVDEDEDFERITRH